MRTAGQGPRGFKRRDGEMRPGQDLIMAGYAGLDGACGIARARREELERRFCSAFLKQLAGSHGTFARHMGRGTPGSGYNSL